MRKKNVLKDFVNVAGALNVSHFVILTKTEISTNMKVARVPKGPTLTFKVKSYSLAKDILSSLKKQSMNPIIFNHPPLLVMNNFSGQELHLKLMTTMFQNMFPSISVNQVRVLELSISFFFCSSSYIYYSIWKGAGQLACQPTRPLPTGRYI